MGGFGVGFEDGGGGAMLDGPGGVGGRPVEGVLSEFVSATSRGLRNIMSRPLGG